MNCRQHFDEFTFQRECLPGLQSMKCDERGIWRRYLRKIGPNDVVEDVRSQCCNCLG